MLFPVAGSPVQGSEVRWRRPMTNIERTPKPTQIYIRAFASFRCWREMHNRLINTQTASLLQKSAQTYRRSLAYIICRFVNSLSVPFWVNQSYLLHPQRALLRQEYALLAQTFSSFRKHENVLYSAKHLSRSVSWVSICDPCRHGD